MTSANMKIWDAVEKTDPSHTKKVNQRGGFTAVSAAYQIKSATEQFGPIGVGWGYEAGAPVFQDVFVIVPVTLWHGDRANTFGPVYGCCEMFGKRPDGDAPKKAGTDALTKLLSQLGFNADVFLGKYDDNKYVAEVTKEFAEKPEPFNSDVERKRLSGGIKSQGDIPTLEKFWKQSSVKALFAQFNDDDKAALLQEYTTRMGELAKDQAA